MARPSRPEKKLLHFKKLLDDYDSAHRYWIELCLFQDDNSPEKEEARRKFAAIRDKLCILAITRVAQPKDPKP